MRLAELHSLFLFLHLRKFYPSERGTNFRFDPLRGQNHGGQGEGRTTKDETWLAWVHGSERQQNGSVICFSLGNSFYQTNASVEEEEKDQSRDVNAMTEVGRTGRWTRTWIFKNSGTCESRYPRPRADFNNERPDIETVNIRSSTTI